MYQERMHSGREVMLVSVVFCGFLLMLAPFLIDYFRLLYS
jgi:hypothetical protein